VPKVGEKKPTKTKTDQGEEDSVLRALETSQNTKKSLRKAQGVKE